MLCDRPLDQVVFAATHNSMDSAADGFLLGNHSQGLVAQLNAGYRGLLIDVYLGLGSPDTPIVITDRAPLSEAQRDELVAELGEPTVRAAEQLQGRVRQRGGVRATYLCHGFCEAGATPFEPELIGIREWLRAHPREVLVVFIEDHVPPDAVVETFAAAGLDDQAYVHRRGQAWPTLREMIDTGHRLLVMAENQAGGAAWYHDGFVLTQETPYSFRSVDQFSCAETRGRPDSPLSW